MDKLGFCRRLVGRRKLRFNPVDINNEKAVTRGVSLKFIFSGCPFPSVHPLCPSPPSRHQAPDSFVSLSRIASNFPSIHLTFLTFFFFFATFQLSIRKNRSGRIDQKVSIRNQHALSDHHHSGSCRLLRRDDGIFSARYARPIQEVRPHLLIASTPTDWNACFLAM